MHSNPLRITGLSMAVGTPAVLAHGGAAHALEGVRPWPLLAALAVAAVLAAGLRRRRRPARRGRQPRAGRR